MYAITTVEKQDREFEGVWVGVHPNIGLDGGGKGEML